MIDRKALLADLQTLLKQLEVDLRERSDSADVPEVGAWLRAEYDQAKQAERTALTQKQWIDDFLTQIAVAWVLSCVFARFLEDNALVEPPKLAGPGPLLKRARDEHELYFRAHPTETDREYLLHVFDELAGLPGTRDVFGPHNPLRELPQWLSGDAAGELLRFFQKIDANTGVLLHDFTDPEWDTRFLGDLYQDLSEAARKKYALLQTPEFVEEFILDRTLDPALEEFGLIVHHGGTEGTEQNNQEKETPCSPWLRGDSLFKMIDPACGSGHFLLGAFPRILERWQRREPDTHVRELVQRTLDSIHGVDLNPFAVAIARFRLLLAALRACGITKLADAPGFELRLACGDSLYHGVKKQQALDPEWHDQSHHFRVEDTAALNRILVEGTYHCVVANPPYITPKDRAANQAYRKLYPKSCHMKYSLAVPFMERIFQLAVRGDGNSGAAGFTGQITSNSFMKREFGKKLIESFFPTVDLTHVIDTSGAYIPGHGTPTVILFGQNRRPKTDTLRAVMGIRGEPSTPDDPSRGLVWSAIVEQIDDPGSQGEFVSVGDSEWERFAKHPWSIGGGGAAELKERLDRLANTKLERHVVSIGFGAILGEDEVFSDFPGGQRVRQLPVRLRRPLVEGDQVRDWVLESRTELLFPYSADIELVTESEVNKWLWAYRTTAWGRPDFSRKTYRDCGRTYWEYHQIPVDRNRTPLSIVFAFVATHNHFVLDRGGKVFNRSAPVIKLPPDASEEDHLALLGLLNSSTACFWMKQVFHDKGSSVDSHGARQTTIAFENFREFTGTGLQKYPVPNSRPEMLATHLDNLASNLEITSPASVIADWAIEEKDDVRLSEQLSAARSNWDATHGEMIFLQEELDWECYRLYGLTEEDLTYHGDPFPLRFGERSFEILLARAVARGSSSGTTWFSRHGAEAITGPPGHWPEDYARLYFRRHEVQQKNQQIGLIEQPEYKRRWNTEPWESQVERALRSWLLDRLESYFDFDGRMNDEGTATAQVDIGLISVAQLADIAARDEKFLEVGSVYRDDEAFDVQKLVAELVAAESVPLLPSLRYKPSGLRKREQWEETWALQRREDAGEAVEDIPVPPKYKSSDFISSGGARYWALRGKLDVPKERWISFPHSEGADGTLQLCWAGYDHLQQARAISAYFVEVQEHLGGREDPRLVPLLGCLIELLPWLKQWHNEVDAEFGMAMGDYFEGFIAEEAKNLGLTLEKVKEWVPPKKTGGRTVRKSKSKS